MQLTTIALATGFLAAAMAAPSQEAKLVARQYDTPTIPLSWRCGNGETYAFIGCYVDDAQRFIGTQSEIIYPLKSVSECMEKCAAKGKKFCALQNYNECLMDDQPKRPMKLVSPEECRKPCTGKRSEACGAPWRNQVYAEVGVQISTPGMCPAPSYGTRGY